MKIVVTIMELSSDIYKARCPALPGCLVLGRSRQEALERMSSAVAGYLASFDAAVPEKLDLEILEYDQGLRRTPRDGSQAASAARPEVA